MFYTDQRELSLTHDQGNSRTFARCQVCIAMTSPSEIPNLIWQEVAVTYDAHDLKSKVRNFTNVMPDHALTQSLYFRDALKQIALDISET